jgi:cytochrome c oxidase subunit 2
VEIDFKNKDRILLVLLLLIIAGLPFGIMAYDRSLEPRESSPNTRKFTLTGHAQRGWVSGEVQANDIVSIWQEKGRAVKPVITVSKGDRVILKLRSADVTHGFSLKAFGIYVANGIQPGKSVYVSFTADKAGTFVFRCNVFCGDVHQHMEGTLIVREPKSRPDA